MNRCTSRSDGAAHRGDRCSWCRAPDAGKEQDTAERMTPTGAVPPFGAVVFEADALLAGTPDEPRLGPGAVDLLRRLRDGGVPVALIGGVLVSRIAQVPNAFDIVLHPGMDGTALGALLCESARRLDMPVAQVAVVGASVAGVRDARRAGFGLVVGITLTSSRSELEEAGAGLVLDDVRELDLGVLRTDPWVLAYQGFDPAHEGHREALTTLGNGYIGTRGAAPERSDDGVHYPGTYLAGVYNRLVSDVQGRRVEDEHLVNAPNWLPLDLRIEDGPWWSQGGFHHEAERRELDLRRGLLTRRVVLTDDFGRCLEVTQRRLVSMHRPHLAALETVVVPRGWSGRLHVRSGIDASIRNSNVTEYAALASQHLGDVSAREVGPDVLLVEATTSTSRIVIGTAARTVVVGATRTPERRLECVRDGFHAHRFEVTVRDGSGLRIDKTVAIATSRDPAIATPGLAALDRLARCAAGVAGLLAEHEAAWERLWARFRMSAGTGRDVSLVLNLHVFHLLQAASPHTAGLDAGVPARGLHGEGYRGHVFWDELFVLPLYVTHLPAVARALLDYRWRRLDAARDAAARAGLTGALFPWQSGSDGREETPAQLFNVRSRRWMTDNSRRQRHVGLAVAYNAWQYFQATGDTAWLAERGAELIIEVTRHFAALATHDQATNRFHLSGVMGPDEYHDGYPDAPGRGLRDNAYTNVLTAWVCQRALDALAVLDGHDCDGLVARLGIDLDERATWLGMGRRMTVHFLPEGVISQFDGYEALTELDWDRYRATYGNIGRLDLILEAEGDSTNRYKLAKQADVLMLVYLLGPDGLASVLEGLGYLITPESLTRTIDYYLGRTAHGSTLSRVVHASVLARHDPGRAWDTFRDALVADLDDTQGGTTREGIHLGAMAGTVDIVMRAFAGLHTRADVLTFDPRLPPALRFVEFQVLHRGQRIDVTLDHERLRLAAHSCSAASPVHVRVGGTDATLGGGEVLVVDHRAVAGTDESPPAFTGPAVISTTELLSPRAQTTDRPEKSGTPLRPSSEHGP